MKPLQKFFWLAFVIFLAAPFFIWSHLSDGNLRFYQLNIGQGDSALIITPENQTILIDGGPDGKVIDELNQVLPFYQKTIDLVILTHPHADHINGLLPVFQNYRVKNLLYTGVKYGYGAYQQLLIKAANQGTHIILATGEFDLKLGSVLVDLIYPFQSEMGQEFSNLNNSSLALRVIYGQNKIWISGDLEVEVETQLVKSSLDLRADLFKAGHHGSRTSNLPALLDRVQPKWAVISCGVNNQFRHPAPETLRNFYDRKIKVFRTDIDGRVTKNISGL